MRSQESRRLGGGEETVPAPAAAKTRGSTAESARLNPISIPPASFTNSLRETVSLGAMVLYAPLRGLRSPPDGSEYANMASTAAHQAFQCAPHFRVGRIGILIEQRLGRHHPSIEAIAALKSLFRDEGRLDGMRFTSRCEAFERDDLFSDGIRNAQLA